MAQQLIGSYSVTTAPSIIQAQHLKPDKNGYYRCIVGGFGLSNEPGTAFYPMTHGVKRMFEPGGALNRRLTRGYLKGEVKHPDVSGLEPRKALKRYTMVDPDNASHHFRKFDLVSDKDEHGNPVVLVYSELKPSGIKEQVAASALQNTEENVPFSVRAVNRPIVYKGRPATELTYITTYDLVDEPGIKDANQFETAKRLTTLSAGTFTKEDLDGLIQDEENTVGVESDLITSLRMVRDSYGWHRVPVIQSGMMDI